MTTLAKENKLDPVINRKNEIERVIQILSRRTKNNPVLLGEAGVGKTAIVEGLAKQIIANNVPEGLKDKLGLEAGSVSPFGLLNDTAEEVEVFIDKEIYNADIVNFHPNRNTASIELPNEMFHKFLETLGHEIQII